MDDLVLGENLQRLNSRSLQRAAVHSFALAKDFDPGGVERSFPGFNRGEAPSGSENAVDFGEGDRSVEVMSAAPGIDGVKGIIRKRDGFSSARGTLNFHIRQTGKLLRISDLGGHGSKKRSMGTNQCKLDRSETFATDLKHVLSLERSKEVIGFPFG